MDDISVLILAKNEAENIRACIESCRPFAAEVVVIDDFSDDDTAQIAEECGARVVRRALNGDWGAQKTFAVQQAACPWIFVIDADERCTPELAGEIRKAANAGEQTAYRVTRLNHFGGRPVRHGPLSPDRVTRLLPREGVRIEGLVHEKTVHPYPEKNLAAPMLHYTYDNWDQYLAKMNRYSALSAERYLREGRRPRPFADLWLRPQIAFVKMYFLKLGFLDGALGYALAKNYANYTLNKYIKLQEIYARQAGRS